MADELDPRLVNPASLAKASGYTHGLTFPPGGRVLFISGQIGWDRERRFVGDGFAEQFDQALANLLSVVTESGGKPESLGKLTMFVVDKAEYLAARAEIGRAYRQRMGKHYPAMSLVEVKGLLEPRARVEIEGIAVIP